MKNQTEQPRPRYIRKPEHDRRIRRGDDWAGDAWLDTHTGEIVWGVVGCDRNVKTDRLGRKYD